MYTLYIYIYIHIKSIKPSGLQPREAAHGADRRAGREALVQVELRRGSSNIISITIVIITTIITITITIHIIIIIDYYGTYK